MKVVLFCGGFGMRLRGFSESVPKPLVEIGDTPILVHIMKYYASFGHNEFILCLGWKAESIKAYFLKQEEAEILETENGSVSQCRWGDWSIRFTDTGLNACVGERLRQLEPILRDEPCFLANYADGLCNVDLQSLIKLHLSSDAIATFLSVNPTQSFHTVLSKPDGQVVSISAIDELGLWINGGFFVLSGDIFEYMDEGNELVEEPFRRLVEQNRLMTYRHSGFWSCMDTYKEMQQLQSMISEGNTPWALWKPNHAPVFDTSQLFKTNPTNPTV